ncbi:MAG: hypothetical protein ACKOBM_12300, partial [Gammaproteobacteria bacterium]
MSALECGWSVAQMQGARAYQEDRFAVLDGSVLHIDGETVSVEAFGVSDSQLLIIVADGMGAMGHGDVAAELVIRQFVDTWLDFAAADIAPRERLSIAAFSANQRVGR